MPFYCQIQKRIGMMIMAEAVYILCSILSFFCTAMLLRGYIKSHSRLLLWSAWCFGVFMVNNIFLSVDMIIFPELDMSGPFWRNLLGATSGSLLLFGLIWEIK